MSELISGKEALRAISDGEVVEIWFNSTDGWNEIKTKDAYSFDLFLDQKQIRFRLKPRTITINGIEVKPLTKNCPIYENDGVVKIECDSQEDAVKLVAALRSIFK